MEEFVMLIFILPLIVVALLMVPFLLYAKRIKNGGSPKKAFIGNLCTFCGTMGLAILIPIGKIVFAAEETGSVKAVLTTGAGLGYLAAGLAVGLACVGSGIAVSAGASAAIGATSENPDNFVKSLIFVVLGEGIALYGLLIAILIISNVGSALGL